MIRYSENLHKSIRDVIEPYVLNDSALDEPSFYGASANLAKRLGIDNVQKSFSSWSHGCHFTNLKHIEQVVWGQSYVLNRLVSNERVATFLRENNYKKVYPVGLPINYVEGQGVARREKSVLLMPAHSLSYVQFDPKIEKYVDFALQLKARGYIVCFCVHADCVKLGKITPVLDENGLDWFVGSAVNDFYSLQRMRNIFEYFDAVGSNVIGSHFFYSQLFGAKFFFTEPYFEYKIDYYKKDPHWGAKRNALSFALSESSKDVIKSRFPKYFLGYENSVSDKNLAEVFCGSAYRVCDKDLAQLLGWGVSGRLISLAGNFKYRITRKINDLLSLGERN